LRTVRFHAILYFMLIEQTVEIPVDHRVFLDLPRSVPAGTKARISIVIPAIFESQSAVEPKVKSFRGILKDKGISVERLREMQREDKSLEDAADNRQNLGTR